MQVRKKLTQYHERDIRIEVVNKGSDLCFRSAFRHKRQWPHLTWRLHWRMRRRTLCHPITNLGERDTHILAGFVVTLTCNLILKWEGFRGRTVSGVAATGFESDQASRPEPERRCWELCHFTLNSLLRVCQYVRRGAGTDHCRGPRGHQVQDGRRHRQP